ncbi:LysM peptidoglycan-binding domain-containing protein [Nonlabens sp. Hel1_33_55]|uniref:PBP1 and LysM peptidoglycan-binding domain-containing protein n=1 Tax=Nonlabens sp. Hel1_33_55 TaxID=1336802 RepID=UPI000B88EE56|nr:LysM peptidoglycan-binding domain-containing protein [Nonlabens sp. Hel1_33_55]
MIRYITVILLVCFAFAKANSSTFQSYERHVVEQGDTMYMLTNKYNVTAEQLMELNPDLKLGLKSGATLLIPKSMSAITNRPIEEYETHKVKRKETLYSLSREYGVTELDIKEANKELYSSPLRKGDRIKIPVFKNVAQPEKPIVIDIIPGVTDIVKVSEAKVEVKKGQYRVKKSEGKYRVAVNNNITMAQLEAWNPDLGELDEGMIVNVVNPKDMAASTENISKLRYISYEVEPKMTMYSLEKMSGLKADSLIAINPALKDGVKKGMTIKIPYRGLNEKEAPELWNSTAKYARLVDSLKNFKNQRIAVMLPLSISGVSSDEYGDQLKKSNIMRIATDFYSGMMIARDSAKTLGVNVQFDVFDTGNSESATLKIVRDNNFKNYNSVIGPLLAKNVVAVAKELKDDDIPVISPLTNTSVRLYKNLFQARPDEQFLMNRLKNYLVGFSKNKNVIIVTDNKNPQFKDEFAPLFPNAKILYPDKNNYISSYKYTSALSKEMDNVVIMAVDQVGFITDAVSNYAAKARTHNITMVGMDDYDDMNVNNMGLAAVNYTYPKMNRNTSSENVFATHYFAKHGITPSNYATRGFDVTMDVILRQASADNLYESAVRNGKTIMVENSFEYNKRFLAGFYNEACYILRFQPDLSIEEVSIYGE